MAYSLNRVIWKRKAANMLILSNMKENLIFITKLSPKLVSLAMFTREMNWMLLKDEWFHIFSNSMIMVRNLKKAKIDRIFCFANEF